ncbi:hypothetical protein [Shewanella xiamenensis]|uniref:hypothetical protein n=1 Tax=Shewanella xiamenensis TaxID=332186 RepID=UPI001CC49271|nr:hypothetical protein [Shewanella xiamenensis]BDA63005.1 hypothetical protein NUITMVS1_44680 [Shewanella xiamenensis]
MNSIFSAESVLHQITLNQKITLCDAEGEIQTASAQIALISDSPFRDVNSKIQKTAKFHADLAGELCGTLYLSAAESLKSEMVATFKELMNRLPLELQDSFTYALLDSGARTRLAKRNLFHLLH